jgi:hypothetical protein
MAGRSESEEMVATEASAAMDDEEGDRWARLLPELVAEVVPHVEASGGHR